MADSFATERRLVPRGGVGLCCDEEGVALGPVPLIAASRDASGRRQYETRSTEEIVDALQLAFGQLPEDIVRRGVSGLGRIVKALAAGDYARAAIAAVQIGLPEIAPERMAKLAQSSLCKFNPYHDERGRFTFAPDGISEASSREDASARASVDHQRNVTISRDDGSSEIRSGGSRTWRDNNPGAIRFGPFASDHGAIGQDGPFAIFPDADTGHRAMTDLLNSADYRDLTLEQAIKKWAPETENDSETYVANVSSWTGIARDKVLRSMSPAQIEAVASAIRRQEGWAPGTVGVVPNQRK